MQDIVITLCSGKALSWGIFHVEWEMFLREEGISMGTFLEGVVVFQDRSFWGEFFWGKFS